MCRYATNKQTNKQTNKHVKVDNLVYRIKSDINKLKSISASLINMHIFIYANQNTRTPSIGAVLQALSGPPLNNKQEDGQMATNGNDDRSPLIDRELTMEKLAAIGATSFDNIASVTEADQSLSGHSASSTAGTGSCGSGNTSPASVITMASSTASSTVFFAGNGSAPMSSSSEKAHGHSSSSWWSMSKSSGNSATKPSTASAASSSSNNGASKKRKPRLSIVSRLYILLFQFSIDIFIHQHRTYVYCRLMRNKRSFIHRIISQLADTHRQTQALKVAEAETRHLLLW